MRHRVYPTLLSLISFLPDDIKSRLPHDVHIEEISPDVSARLNRLYRKKKKTAQVLSFRYNDSYGEILLCPFVLKKEAKKYGYSYGYYRTRMIVHGLLHLAGIHHEKSERARARSEKIERAALRRLFP